MKKIGNFFKKVFGAIKNIPWTAPVKPLVAWCTYGGVIALTVVLMLIFWL